MRHHIASAAVAGLLLATTLVIGNLWYTRSDALGLVASIATWPIYPAFYIMIFTGPYQGPDGLPDLIDVYILSFMLWWLVIDIGLTVFRNAKEARTTARFPRH